MHTSIPAAAGTGLFPGTGPHMLWDTDLTVRRIWMEISVPRLPLVQVEDFVSSLFAVIVCSPGSHHHSLVCTGFSFCILIGKADWCTEGIDRIYFFISSFFLLVPEESTRHVFASSDFWAMHPFHTGAWTTGRTGHLVVTWVDEYLSHGLRAKPEPCYGKVNKWCYLIIPSCSSWILQGIVFKGLKSKPTVNVETQGIYLKFFIATLSSFPSMLWLCDPLGWHCAQALFPPLRILLAMWKPP